MISDVPATAVTHRPPVRSPASQPTVAVRTATVATIRSNCPNLPGSGPVPPTASTLLTASAPLGAMKPSAPARVDPAGMRAAPVASPPVSPAADGKPKA